MLSAHMKLQIWWLFLSFQLEKNAHSLLYPFLFHFCQLLHGHLLPQSGGIDAPLAKASGLMKIYFRRILTWLVPPNPAITRRRAAIIHPWILWSSTTCATSLGLASSKVVENIHACQIHCGAYHTTMPQHWSAALLPLPVFPQQILSP